MAGKKTASKQPTKTKPPRNEKHPGDVYKALFQFQQRRLSLPRNGRGIVNNRAYSYVTLDDLINGIRPHLEECELVFAQVILKTQLITALVHAPTGTKIESELELGAASNMQDYGSRITYARRYALTALLGLNAEEDVDATGSKVPPAAPAQPAPEAKHPDEKPLPLPDTHPARSTLPDSHPAGPTGPSTPMPTPEGSTGPSEPLDDPKTTLMSDSYLKARQAIETAFTVEALDLIAGKIERSERINERERKMLLDMLANRRSLIVFDKIK